MTNIADPTCTLDSLAYLPGRNDMELNIEMTPSTCIRSRKFKGLSYSDRPNFLNSNAFCLVKVVCILDACHDSFNIAS